MTGPKTYPNPDLTVGADNKQGWNQPANRRHGFHNAHLLWRRVLLVRSRRTLALEERPAPEVAVAVHRTGLARHPAFSALVVAQGGRILHAAQAADFGVDRPHSIQSVTKMHMHLILGELIDEKRVDPLRPVSDYLPWIGSAYSSARVVDVADMNVTNDFTEDYDDPLSGCYAEEEALGWRLPDGSRPEITLREFAAGLTGGDLINRSGYAIYKSANTDVLALIAAAAGGCDLIARLGAIVDAAGYEGGLHISLSPDMVPAFSGGGCLSARDLARFGLLLARGGTGVDGTSVGSAGFTRRALLRDAPLIGPTRPGVRYSGQLMTNGRWIGHAGYGGQFLMIDMTSGAVAAFLSVLENDSGYDEAYMTGLIQSLDQVLAAVPSP